MSAWAIRLSDPSRTIIRDEFTSEEQAQRAIDQTKLTMKPTDIDYRWIGAHPVQVDAEHQRPRVTRARLETPTTVKTTINIVRRATHDLDEGIY